MKMRNLLVAIFALLLLPVFTGCNKVPAGHAGVKVYLLGGAKGVDNEVVGPGRYWIGWNEELFLFPLYTVTYTWTKEPIDGDATDESISFQTKEGLTCNADVGISYHIENDKVAAVFQKYRKGIDEITDQFLRNHVRDAFVTIASGKEIESVYGAGKAQLIEEVQKAVAQQVTDIGITVEKIYYTGELRLPPEVTGSINAKIQATQIAQQRENELRQAEASAKKVVAEAQGTAQAMLAKATAEAEALKLKNQALTPQLVQYEAVQRWNGILPTFTGGSAPLPFIQMPTPVAPTPTPVAEAPR